MTTAYEFKTAGVTVYVDGPDKNDTYTFQMEVVRDKVKETNFYQRRSIGWFFLFGDVWHRTEQVPHYVVTARIRYGSGEFP